MARLKRTDTLLAGKATAEGTRGYEQRFSSAHEPDFYRPFADGLRVSSLGLGTYLGECDDAEDQRYAQTISLALRRGINLLDTAINYRCQRSERAVGSALRSSVASGAVNRDEVVVCTKGGYIPLDWCPPNTREGYRGFLQSEYFGPGVMTPSDVVAGGHCLTQRYLADQIGRSRRNLGIECIDVYYLHNPEQQLEVIESAQFRDVIRAAFTTLEEQVSRGAIGVYGCATWQGFRVPPSSRNHLGLEALLEIAVEAGGKGHHFRAIQLPVNLAMAEAARLPTQQLAGNGLVPALEAAAQLGVSVVGSATLMQSQLTRSLPAELGAAFPGFASDAQRAIAFARSMPVSVALVGMKAAEHLEENLQPAVAV